MTKKEALIYEQSHLGRSGTYLPQTASRRRLQDLIPSHLLRREQPQLPAVPENEVVRHFVRLSVLNYGVDTGMYPLGSCTMKYNPKIAEYAARKREFVHTHPYQDADTIQGLLAVMYELGEDLKSISGMDAVSLQPAAGAHGELTGILICRAYHTAQGNPRSKILVPDSAHGTNPATASMCGYRVVSIPSTARGTVDTHQLSQQIDGDTAALMITNPNTLGIFEDEIEVISDMVHASGGLMYYDGANMNAIMGYTKPDCMGFDLVHFNLHKTFGTPHGTGGPGAGPLAVRAQLAPFLPYPTIGLKERIYTLDCGSRDTSIGKVRSFFGNFLVLLKAYLYIRAHGSDGLKKVSQHAVLNANYLRKRVAGHLDMPYAADTLHEFVLSAVNLKKRQGVGALDIAKSLLDYGFHPPTVYFPLIVKEAVMIEPTDTETRETLDAFAASLAEIVKKAETNPAELRTAPNSTLTSRPDEIRANRHPVLRARSLDARVTDNADTY